jgi:hypothetical protein
VIGVDFANLESLKKLPMNARRYGGMLARRAGEALSLDMASLPSAYCKVIPDWLGIPHIINSLPTQQTLSNLAVCFESDKSSASKFFLCVCRLLSS